MRWHLRDGRRYPQGSRAADRDGRCPRSRSYRRVPRAEWRAREPPRSGLRASRPFPSRRASRANSPRPRWRTPRSSVSGERDGQENGLRNPLAREAEQKGIDVDRENRGLVLSDHGERRPRRATVESDQVDSPQHHQAQGARGARCLVSRRTPMVSSFERAPPYGAHPFEVATP